MPAKATLVLPEADPAGDISQAEVIVLSDGRVGHENQSLGVAEMLGFKDPEILTLERGIKARWLAWLPVSKLFGNYEAIAREVARAAQGPLVLIGTGYHISRALRSLKKANPRAFTVCLMRPAGKLDDFDVVAVPQHDRGVVKKENVVVTLGPANRITRDKLVQEGERWKKRLSHVPQPRLAVLVGGASKRGGFGIGEMQKMMLAIIEAARKQGMGLLVTTSRRTGEDATEAVQTLLEKSGIKHMFWQPDDPTQRDNPYLAFLALAEGVVATGDSASMVCEAATSGKPVYLWGVESSMAKKFRALYAGLVKQGRAKWWDGHVNLRPPAAGLMDTLMIAGFVRARWQKRALGASS